MQLSFTAAQIAEILKGTVEGDPNVSVSGFSKIEEGETNTLTFLANPKYTNYIYDTKASIVLVTKTLVLDKPVKATLIRCEDAYASLAFLLEMVEKFKNGKTGIEQLTQIDPTATIGIDVYVGSFTYIGKNVKIGNNVKIYPQCFIGDNCTIDDNTILYAGVKIYADCIVGKYNIIHSGAVIGSDGFGHAPQQDGTYKKIPQLGNVVIGDFVEVGANTTIDCAVFGSTKIGNGVKLDNLVQIAHNVEIGENTVMAAQCGISGSTKIGKNCMFGGQVGIAGHITIGDKCKIGAQSGIGGSLKENQQVIGYPALPIKRFYRSSVIFGRLPEMYKEVNGLSKRLQDLELKLDKN